MKPEQILKMYDALKKISTCYQTPAQLQKSCDKQYGLSYDECLEMAYQNLQAEAKAAIKGVRISTLKNKP